MMQKDSPNSIKSVVFFFLKKQMVQRNSCVFITPMSDGIFIRNWYLVTHHL